MARVLFLATLILACSASAPHPKSNLRTTRSPIPDQNNVRPVIGILSLPMHPYEPFNVTGNTYIASSYVKWLESGGARVVPIKSNDSEENIRDLFTKLNGVLFTGGTVDFFENDVLTDYAQKGCLLYNLTVEANQQGVYQPLWSICLGYELMNLCANNAVQDTVQDYHGKPAYPHNITMRPEAPVSRMLSNLSGGAIEQYLSEKTVAYFNHNHGISPSTYDKYPALGENFDILGTSFDHDNTEYIAFIEHKTLPIYGTQFHPEKNDYEWGKVDMDTIHTQQAVSTTNYLAEFFVSEARRNDKKFDSGAELEEYIIYNYEPYYLHGYFEQIYHMD